MATIKIDARIPVWSHPASYGGHSPDGDYVVYSQHRDSDALERSNYRRIYQDVLAKAIELGQPEGINVDYAEGNDKQWVYDFRASHWAVGWVEYIILRATAPDELVEFVGEIHDSLADYPLYDEGDFSALETSESEDYWSGLDVKGRIEVIKESGSGLSIFAARRDSLPDNDRIWEWVRTP